MNIKRCSPLGWLWAHKILRPFRAESEGTPCVLVVGWGGGVICRCTGTKIGLFTDFGLVDLLYCV
jgi:hypothetical protein